MEFERSEGVIDSYSAEEYKRLKSNMEGRYRNMPSSNV